MTPSSIPTTATERLLLRLVRAAWDSPAATLPTDGLREADWTGAVQLALNHGVAGLMCRGLQRVPGDAIPPEMAAAAETFLVDAQARGSAAIADLFAILDTLADERIPALAFKGPALAAIAYGSAWIRPSRDLDLLCARDDMDRAIRALARLGYRSDQADLSPRVTAACHDYVGQDILFAQGRIPVEPHCAFAPAALAIDLDMEGMRARARAIAIDGREVRTLGVEDTILTACLHGWKDQWWRLLWVADVAALLHRRPGPDWKVLEARAQEAGVRRILHLGLALARDLFDAPLPEHVGRAIAAEHGGDWLLQESKARLFRPAARVPSQNYVSRYHFVSRERAADRLRYLWRTMTTPRIIHFRMLKLPDPLFFGYFAVKLAHDYLALPLWRLTAGRRARARSEAPDAAT